MYEFFILLLIHTFLTLKFNTILIKLIEFTIIYHFYNLFSILIQFNHISIEI